MLPGNGHLFDDGNFGGCGVEPHFKNGCQADAIAIQQRRKSKPGTGYSYLRTLLIQEGCSVLIVAEKKTD